MKMLIVVRLRPDADISPPLLEAQLRATWALHRDPAVRAVEQLADAPGAVLTVEVRGVDEARALVEALPLVRARLATVEVLGVGPYVGWEKLFRGASDVR